MEQIMDRNKGFVQGSMRRFLYQQLGEFDLPLYIESIGLNLDQESIIRSKGYPVFHWLQTVQGEGEFELSGRRFSLPPGNGALLFPGVPHSYAAKGKKWTTLYVTFGGAIAAAMLASLGIRHTEWLHWEEDAPLTAHLMEMIEQAQHDDDDRTGLTASAQLYRFLTLIKVFGQTGGRSSLFQHLEKLDPLLIWLDEKFSDPDIGLNDMSAQLRISARYLNSLFRQAFGITAYAYLIRLRLRKAKELMSLSNHHSIKMIAQLSGYRDVSHFISAFGKTEGMTPEQFRKLHGLTSNQKTAGLHLA